MTFRDSQEIQNFLDGYNGEAFVKNVAKLANPDSTYCLNIADATGACSVSGTADVLAAGFETLATALDNFKKTNTDDTLEAVMNAIDGILTDDEDCLLQVEDTLTVAQSEKTFRCLGQTVCILGDIKSSILKEPIEK